MDDFFSMFNDAYNSSTSTETESGQIGYSTPSYGSENSQNQYSSHSYDDYSVTPNYQEQFSYGGNNDYQSQNFNQPKVIREMETPMVERSAPAVNLTKTKQRIMLSPRMKIVVSSFSIIMFSLLFLIIWNFVQVGTVKASINEKEQIVVELQADIKDLEAEYNPLVDVEQVKTMAEKEGWVEVSDDNTVIIKMSETYSEPTYNKISSNWFNDVCEFLSKLFA